MSEMLSGPYFNDTESKAHESTVETIVNRIRKDIIEGKLKAGQKLGEVHVSKQLNTSRTPVREAFRILQSEGFLTYNHGSGVMVATFTKEDARQLWEVRSLIEKTAAAQAALHVTPELMEELKELQTIMEKMGHEDYVEYNALDTRWHMFIANASGNMILKDVLERLWVRAGLIRTWSVSTGKRVVESWTEHRNVLAAIEAGDPVLASRYMEIHFENSLRAVMGMEDDRKPATKMTLIK